MINTDLTNASSSRKKLEYLDVSRVFFGVPITRDIRAANEQKARKKTGLRHSCQHFELMPSLPKNIYYKWEDF